MQFFQKPNIDFIGNRRYGYIFSTCIILIGLIALILRGGPNWGIDFKGGVSIKVKFNKMISVENLRVSLGRVGLETAEIKRSEKRGPKGVEEEFIIRVEQLSGTGGISKVVIDQFKNDFGDNNFDVRSIETVGPKIGRELRRAAILAVFVALVLILIYVSWRFEFRFGIGAIIPLFHDVLVTLGLFAILNLEVSLAVVAAFLTIVGYSLNDTIVVFDRIREDLKIRRKEKYEIVINQSINETLSRTIITSLTTLIVVAVLFFFGGDVIHSFAFALLVGITIGTYSSIFVASPILVEWEQKVERRLGKAGGRHRK